MTRDLGDGARSLHALAHEMPGAGRAAVNRAAIGSARTIRAGLARAAGGDMTLRNAGAVGVRVQIGADSASIGAVGAVALLEGTVRPHVEEPRRGRALSGDLRHPVARVRHPGYRARHVWSEATGRAAETQGGPALQRTASPALRDAYRGG